MEYLSKKDREHAREMKKLSFIIKQSCQDNDKLKKSLA